MVPHRRTSRAAATLLTLAAPAAIGLAIGLGTGAFFRTPASASGGSKLRKIRKTCDTLSRTGARTTPVQTCTLTPAAGGGFDVRVRKTFDGAHQVKLKVGKNRYHLELHQPDDTGLTCKQADIAFHFFASGKLDRLDAKPHCVKTSAIKPKSQKEIVYVGMNDGDLVATSLRVPTFPLPERAGISFAMHDANAESLASSMSSRDVGSHAASSGLNGAASSAAANTDSGFGASRGAMAEADSDFDDFGDVPETPDLSPPMPAGGFAQAGNIDGVTPAGFGGPSAPGGAAAAALEDGAAPARAGVAF